MKNNNNTEIITTREAKKYLDFITATLDNLIINRQIYLDFHNALIQQKSKDNHFIRWAMNNYYQALILNLCKLLERKGTWEQRRTLQHFLNLCKEPTNWETFKRSRLGDKIFVEDPATKKKEELSYYDYIVRENFNNVEVNDDLEKIKSFHDELSDLRNHGIAHLTVKKVEAANLNFERLHKIIDELDEIIKKYYHLFGIGIDNSDLKRPCRYNNFKLTLK